MAHRLRYRPDIDGLRAVAVIPVLLFHGNFAWFRGGYVGVDIFFVISGFLISSIIISELDNDSFSFARFYERRARRILPALITVLATTILASYFFALPSQYESTSASAIAATLSVSNIYFWSQMGYFSALGELQPLLHTWSLGVEEQFYLAFPALLVLLARIKKASFKTAIATALPPMFLVALYLSYDRPSFAFYWLPARAWELAIGALLATNAIPPCRSRAIANFNVVLGAALIASSIVYLDDRVVFPGFAALLPCIGTVLVLRASSPGTWLYPVLSSAPLRGIGLISYSLYLWHWPVLSFTRMRFAEIHLTTAQSATAIAISFVLALATWRFVESPFRNRELVSTPLVWRSALAGAVLLVLGCVFVIQNRGFPERLPGDALSAFSAKTDVDPLREECHRFATRRERPGCSFGSEDADVSYVVLGDSHAAALRPAVAASLAGQNRAGRLWWDELCPMLVGAKRYRHPGQKRCERFREQALDELAGSDEVDVVFLAGRWVHLATGIAPEVGGSYRDELVDEASKTVSADETLHVFERSLDRTLSTLLEMDKKVVILGSVPEIGFGAPTLLALAAYHGLDEPRPFTRDEVAANQALVDEIFSRAAERDGVYYVRVWDLFCADECGVTIDGTALYADDNHITYHAAANVAGPLLGTRLPSDLFAAVDDSSERRAASR